MKRTLILLAAFGTACVMMWGRGNCDRISSTPNLHAWPPGPVTKMLIYRLHQAR